MSNTHNSYEWRPGMLQFAGMQKRFFLLKAIKNLCLTDDVQV